MQRCGQCPSCQNPHHKKACSLAKAAREADRASRHDVPSRRHRLSLDPVPLAKLAQQPGIGSPARQKPQSQPNHVTARDNRSPSIDPEAEAPSHRTFEGERGKRAATQDSDNELCHKRSRLTADCNNEPEQGAASGMASRDTHDPVSWQPRQVKSACCTANSGCCIRTCWPDCYCHVFMLHTAICWRGLYCQVIGNPCFKGPHGMYQATA